MREKDIRLSSVAPWRRGRPTGLQTKWGQGRATCPMRRLVPLQEDDLDEADWRQYLASPVFDSADEEEAIMGE